MPFLKLAKAEGDPEDAEVAVFYFKGGSGTVDQNLKRQLAKFKAPKTIDFTDEMPRDPNGKLYKRKLRDPYWEGVQRQL